MTIIDTSALKVLLKKNKTAEAEKELNRLLASLNPVKGGKKKPSLVTVAAALAKAHTDVQAAYNNKLEELTELVKEAASLQDTVSERIQISQVKGKIKDL
jgi:ABC-type transporter Mla subunit MlaD